MKKAALVPILQPGQAPCERASRSEMNGYSQAPVHGRACPFCGLATDVPHETQAGCISALHEEIDRVRGVLANVTVVAGMAPDTGDESSLDRSRREAGDPNDAETV